MFSSFKCSRKYTLNCSSSNIFAAVEVHGHDKTIIVGLEDKIYCSTHLNATRMEWFLVGVDDKPVEADLDEQQLTLTIDAQTTGLNGAMFTCRVTDVEGKQYEETVTITVKGKFRHHGRMVSCYLSFATPC